MHSLVKIMCLQDFFQDKLMKFQCYPEMLMVDSTCKLNDLRMLQYNYNAYHGW